MAFLCKSGAIQFIELELREFQFFREIYQDRMDRLQNSLTVDLGGNSFAVLKRRIQVRRLWAILVTPLQGSIDPFEPNRTFT